jgi:hypothetical protein
MEKTMKTMILSAGIIVATMAATPVLAQEATQEPGAMGFFYPESHYLTGGHGSHASPRPGYYYRPHAIGEQGALPAGAPAVSYYGYGYGYGPGYE